MDQYKFKDQIEELLLRNGIRVPVPTPERLNFQEKEALFTLMYRHSWIGEEWWEELLGWKQHTINQFKEMQRKRRHHAH